VRGDVTIDSETLLMTDFVNLKIKPAQSFRDAYKSMVCVRVFIGVSAHTYMSIYVYTVFHKIFFKKRNFGHECNILHICILDMNYYSSFPFPYMKGACKNFLIHSLVFSFGCPAVAASLSPPLFIAQNLTPRDAKTPSLLPHTTRGTREGIGKAQDSHPWRL
jgi:hypothetical protein